MKIDLHIHSTASDGKLSPKELVDWAIKKEIKCIAITDHDIIDGSKEAVEYARGKSIEIVPGIEIGADDEDLGIYDAHVVGLFLDLENKALVDLSERLMRAREIQKKEIIKRLNNIGYKITFEELRREVIGVNYGRPHIARILMRKYSEFESMEDVFNKLLGNTGVAHVRQKKDTIRDVIGAIHDAGGVAILAHPMLYKNPEKVIDRFVEEGGDGLEVDYFYENRSVSREEAIIMRKRVAAIAVEKGLIVSGGGDFHSEEDPQKIGDFGLTGEEFEKLREYWKKNDLSLVEDSFILNEVKGSDHCPVGVELL